MARHHGSRGTMSWDAITLASINKWSLSLARDSVDVTCFGDTNKVYVRGLPDIKGSFSAVYDPSASSPNDGNTPIFGFALGEASVTLKLTPVATTATDYAEGAAFVDANIDVDAKGAVTMGGSFMAADSWTLFGAMAA